MEMSMSVVRIFKGSYRGSTVVDTEFKLVKGFQSGKKGNYITVRNEGQFDIAIDTVKVKVESMSDFEFVGGETAPAGVSAFVSTPVVQETDDEAMARIRTRFSILDEMSAATTNGGIRAMIVSGPPGVGKSYGVEQQLEKAAMFDKIAGRPIKFEIVKGAMTALGLYATLFKHSDKNHVLVFDDCDSVLMDDLALNILKAALDSGKRRRIYWNSDSSMLRREGIPDSFDFNGSCIFITNIKFDHLKSKKLQDHLEALQSRCHFLDLTIDTERDKMLRIKQVHNDTDGGLFRDYFFQFDEGDQVLQFMWDQKARLRELSMRMALKIADLVKISPTNWRNLAENTVMKRV
jgi:hypothetical protein